MSLNLKRVHLFHAFFFVVNETNLFKKYAQYFSFFEKNGKRILTCFLSSNNHGGTKER